MSLRFSILCVSGAIVGLVMLSQPVLAQSKHEMYGQMLGLAAQMQLLKPHLADTPGAADLFRQLQLQYQQMSDQLGGDDPARTLVQHAEASNEPRSGSSTTSYLRGLLEMPEGPPPFPVPPGCAYFTDIQGNVTNAPIPDLGTIADSVTFSGLQGVIWYVDSVVVLPHQFSGDLDFTLTSPSGTTITYSSDNGGANANVFGVAGGAGSFFLDTNDSFGALPYVTNDNLVTDHPYANNVTVTHLVPEEALRAFEGEDPNGVWTITVTDDAGQDVGLLWGWDVFIGTVTPPQSETTRTFSSTAPVAIADFTLSSSSIDVSGMAEHVCDVKVQVDINHTYANDLDLTLTNPFGLIVSLSTGNGGEWDDVFEGTIWTDDGDPGAPGARNTTNAIYTNLLAKTILTPEEPLSLARVWPPNGTWTLTVYDHANADVGMLNNWKLILTTCSCSPGCPGDMNGDGVANISDLLGVIGAWGICP